MSDFSLTLVLHIKTSKIINDMAKLQKNLRKSPLLVENFSFWANQLLKIQPLKRASLLA